MPHLEFCNKLNLKPGAIVVAASAKVISVLPTLRMAAFIVSVVAAVVSAHGVIAPVPVRIRIFVPVIPVTEGASHVAIISSASASVIVRIVISIKVASAIEIPILPFASSKRGAIVPAVRLLPVSAIVVAILIWVVTGEITVS